ncbi:MAG: hypothetical protein JRD89_21100 [Deltaproteobacteria bacterium]|nr:hypothetical protein [Deltaproteobacteria bacterium]
MPETATVGDSVEVTVDVTNTGEVAGGCDVGLTIDGYTDSQGTGMLTASAGTTLTFFWDTTGLDPGDYTVTVESPDDILSDTIMLEAAGPPMWEVGHTWVFDSKYYMDPPTLYEDDTETVVVGAIDSAGTPVGGYVAGKTFTLPEDCYRTDTTFVNDAEPPGQLVMRNTEIGLVSLHPDYPALTWIAQDTLDEVYREACVGSGPSYMATLFVWKYYDPTTGAPTEVHGWPYDVGKEWRVYTTVEVWVEPMHLLLDTIVNYSIIEVEGETSVTVPAGTFTVKHIVTYESNAVWQKFDQTSETWQSDEVKFRVKYIDRATYIGELVDELIDTNVIP